eukprot:m.609848 g.609848  ORF g.609848 m.609848 type:complete len:653 (-) comp22492_c0_seq4:31-1989(-)
MGLFVPASWTLTSFSTCRTICILVVAQNLCSPDTVLAAVSCNTCNKQILNLTLERVSPSQYVHSQSAEVLLFWGSTAGHAALDLTARHNTTSYNLIDTFTNIQVGDTFTIPVSPSFPASIRLECNITGSLTMVSTVIFRTACDQPIYVGDIFGNFKVTGYTSSLGVTFNASTDSCQFLDYPPPDLIHYVAPDTCEACNSTNMRALRNVTFMWLSLDSYAASVSIAGSDASTVAIVSHGRISYNSVFVQSGDNFTVDASQHSGGVLPGEVVIDVFSNLVQESTQVGCTSGLVAGHGVPVAGGSLVLLSFSETVQNAEQICAEEGFGLATSTVYPSGAAADSSSDLGSGATALLVGLFAFILSAALVFVILRCWLVRGGGKDEEKSSKQVANNTSVSCETPMSVDALLTEVPEPLSQLRKKKPLPSIDSAASETIIAPPPLPAPRLYAKKPANCVAKAHYTAVLGRAPPKPSAHIDSTSNDTKTVPQVQHSMSHSPANGYVIWKSSGELEPVDTHGSSDRSDLPKPTGYVSFAVSENGKRQGPPLVSNAVLPGGLKDVASQGRNEEMQKEQASHMGPRMSSVQPTNPSRSTAYEPPFDPEGSPEHDVVEVSLILSSSRAPSTQDESSYPSSSEISSDPEYDNLPGWVKNEYGIV